MDNKHNFEEWVKTQFYEQNRFNRWVTIFIVVTVAIKVIDFFILTFGK